VAPAYWTGHQHRPGHPLPGTGLAPATVQDLWYQGAMAAAPTFTSSAPQAPCLIRALFQPCARLLDCGIDEGGPGGTLTCDNITYGNAFNGPDFTWECYFKSDTTMTR